MLPIYLQTVMAQMQEDEQLALAEIYRQHLPLMLKIAQQYLSVQEDIEDAAHNAVLAIARNIKKVKELQSSQVAVYVALAAKSAAIDLYRKRHRQAPLPLPAELADNVNIPVEAATANSYDRVLAYIKTMPPQYIDPLILHITMDLQARDIALTLGRPVGTVKTQLRRGHKLLQKQFREMQKK